MNWELIGWFAALTVVAGVWLLVPLLRKTKEVATFDQREGQLAVFAAKVEELKAEVAEGKLTEEHFELAVAEMERELAESGGLAKGMLIKEGQKPWLVIVAAVLTPLAAWVIYFGWVGEPNLGSKQAKQQMQQMLEGGTSPGHLAGDGDDTTQFRVLAKQLEQKLAANPDDADSWVLLAKTHFFLQDFPKAAHAYGQAVAKGLDDDPNLLASYADVLAVVQNSLAGKPTELLEQALKLDPNHPQSLWLSGSAAFYAQDYDKAASLWQKLLNNLPEDSQEADILRGNLAEVKARKAQLQQAN